MRAGAQALTLLSVPLNSQILTALEDKRMSLIDIRRAAGSPPASTIRKQLHELRRLGILEDHRQSGFPGSIDYELTDAGHALSTVGGILQDWLRSGPDGPLELGTPAAKSPIKALVDGWSSAIIRALTAKPLSLTELDRLIADVNYPSLDRRLAAMRLAGQITASPGSGRSRPYLVTPWLRRAAAPLTAAARWERRFHSGPVSTITRIDIEAGFLLALPLLSLSADLSGTARLVVEVGGSDGRRAPAGVLVTVARGGVVACSSRTQGLADGWGSGSISAWFEALVDGDTRALEVGGDRELTIALVEGLRNLFFPVCQATGSRSNALMPVY